MKRDVRATAESRATRDVGATAESRATGDGRATAGVSGAWIVGPSGPVTIWGLSPEERLRRSLERAQCGRIESLGPGDPSPTADSAEAWVLVRADVIYDERLVEALVRADADVVLEAPLDGAPEPVAARVSGALLEAARARLEGRGARDLAGLPRVSPDALVPPYIPALRKRQPAYVLPARPEAARDVEARAFDAAYKGLTDLVTKWVWPRPAAAVTRALARRRVHPNTVTLASWLLAIAALVLFWRGAFGAGLTAAWLMTFLDTVDGKLARVTLTSSRVGHVLDHGLDIVHPPFWYLAWGLGLGPAAAAATAVVVGGYVVGRLLEGVFLLAFGFETHSWRPLDGLFRTITARRNPNLILLTVGTAAGRPDLGLVMVALWTVVSLAFHGVRLAQASAARRAGRPVEPWDEVRPGAARPSAGPTGSAEPIPPGGGAAPQTSPGTTSLGDPRSVA